MSTRMVLICPDYPNAQQILTCVVDEKVKNEKKQFFTRTKQKDMLKFSSVSASIGNFRLEEEERSHLPVSIFIS